MPAGYTYPSAITWTATNATTTAYTLPLYIQQTSTTTLSTYQGLWRGGTGAFWWSWAQETVDRIGQHCVDEPTPPAEPELQVRRAARTAARDRAEMLLLSMCTAEQRRSYQEEGWIDGVTNLGRPFRIYCRSGVNGNVELLYNNEWITLCAHPPASLPHADLLLGQKLALETDEQHFMARANVHRARPA